MSNSRNTETIRKRLGLTKQEFSSALGLIPASYANLLQSDSVTDTLALAAEALMRRQAATGDVTFVVQIVKGVPQFCVLDDLETMTLRDQRFRLLPVDDGKIVQVQKTPEKKDPPPRPRRNREPSSTFVEAKRVVSEALLNAEGRPVPATELTQAIVGLFPKGQNVSLGPILEHLRRAGTVLKVSEGMWRANV